MNKLLLSLEKYEFPSSTELKNLTLHDSAFSKRTRYIQTSSNTFNSSNTLLSKSTWSFTSIEKNFLVVREVCEALEAKTKKRVQCNAYYTPPNSQGLPIHYDLHDVLVLQIEGSKLWKIWPAFRRSVTVETLLSDEKENLPNWTAEAPTQELVLTKSQTLYITKGQPHVALTTHESSLHFSFGIYND